MAKLIPTANSIKLSTAQQAVLSTALQHPEGAVLLPDRTKGRAAVVLVESLIAKGLVREIRAKAGLPTWRQDKASGKAFALVITKLGRSAAATLTDFADVASVTAPAHPNDEAKGGTHPSPLEQAAVLPAFRTTEPRPTSKLAGVIGLLTRESGAGVDALMTATGWLPHTVRATLTGLRKRGYAVTREVHDGTSATYHIRLAPATQVA